MELKGEMVVLRYQTILFDADQTLFDFIRSERCALKDALTASGVVPTEGMIEKYSEINAATWKRLERGEITKAELRTARFYTFCQYFALDADVPQMAQNYLTSLAAQSFLLDGALEVCRTLSEQCRLYIITNGIAEVQHGRFDRSPVKPYFSDIFISEEMGAEKPHRTFFDGVARRVPDFDPVGTLVVGDSLTSDMAGGIGAGLDTCWYNPAGIGMPPDMSITYEIRNLGDVVPLVLGT